MKYKTTIRNIKNNAENLVCAGYCDLQTLLRNHSAEAYTKGVYGWNFDVYTVYGVTICTGYRAMPGRRANNVGEYERRAREIWTQYDRPYEERSEAIETLLREFCAQA